jgi:hypothetical protein
MKKLKTPSLVTLAILTTITVIFWVLFNVYRVFTSKPSTSIPSEILEPITPSLDAETIGKIQKGVYLQEGQIPESTIIIPTSSPEATVSPVPNLTPSPTASASPTASPEATPTGTEEST